jgi:molybdopterin-containing oxidoreductase family iron-sulfur binding subunit
LPPDRFLRLYAVESMWRLTGANADQRLALAPHLIRNVALAVANRLGASLPSGDLPEHAKGFAEAVGNDLKAHGGRAIVLAGEGLPPEVHALCHWINAQLKAPIDFIAPVDPSEDAHMESLRALADDLAQGRVQTLLILDSNPAYAAPGELGLAEAIGKVPFSAHLGLYDDETGMRCQWHLPLSHTLESWSDLRALDGTASIVQPLIRPLYDTRSTHEVIGLLQGHLSTSAYQLVRGTWQSHAANGDFESTWRRWLHDGVIAGTAEAHVTPPPAKRPDIAPADASSGLTLAIARDPSIWDGRFGNNAWLQECPKPITKQVWGNALHISPKDAAAHHLHDGDVVTLSRGSAHVVALLHIQEGQAEGVLAATLGYGRDRAGAIGNGIGFNVYPLQTLDAPWTTSGIAIVPTGQGGEMLTTQHYFKLDAEEHDILRSLARVDLSHAEAGASDKGPNLPTLLPQYDYDSYKWAMVIDTTLCIGCNACVIACQSENNVPVVGPGEIGMGRDMHWLRVDTYFVNGEGNPPGFQPVPCMHCEHAPCEPVCPVAASVHDSEGLNVQVYNRCIGTRFCESNCPYKVRRFNFFGYANDQAYANLGETVVQAHFNPDVTVRDRGVMEKCTYCVQRISAARREAEKSDRPIEDGEVVTACQQACPTRAIVFGDLNNKDAAIHKLRDEPHHYALLEHLGTRPRTTYLARLNNPNPALKGDTA